MKLPLEDPTIMHRVFFHLRLRRVIGHLEENPSQTFHLEDAAHIACMERTAFSKFFSQAVGLGFHEFVLAWRVGKATELMTLSDRSLSEIGYDVGFQNLVTFERAFKKFCGCTPSVYRERMLKKRGLIPR